MQRFFENYPKYIVAEPFISRRFSDFFNLDRPNLLEFSRATFAKFDPLRDDRLNFVCDFFSREGIKMIGSVQSMIELENWIWSRTLEWVATNPRPTPKVNDLGELLASDIAFEGEMESDILSLARDISIYEAFCVSTEAQLTGHWKRWSGNQNEMTAGFPIFKYGNHTKPSTLRMTRGNIRYMVSITYGNIPSTEREEFGVLARSLRHTISQINGKE
jgi:hypothetical protein